MSKVENVQKVLERIKEAGIINDQILKGLKDDEKKLVQDLFREGMVDEALRMLTHTNTDEDWQAVAKRIHTTNKPLVYHWTPILKYAAILIGLLGMAYFLIPNKTDVVAPTIAKESIKLRIGDDEVRIIQQGVEQQIVTSSGKILGKQTGNKISYFSDSEVEELVYNELEIPFGEIFNVQLSDGTLVHLNSGTKMRYPVKFIKGQKRIVFIKGEAYFKVAKDKDHPFIVNADEVAVEVLGTEFNISSYKEDSEINTVLVEGSVSMSNASETKNVVLVPGYKAAWNKTTQKTEVEQVDIDLYTGWINGELIFRKSSFDDMAKRLERRYNVSIHNNDLDLAAKKFNARFSVEIESIEDVMKSINEIKSIDYKITDRKIFIN